MEKLRERRVLAHSEALSFIDRDHAQFWVEALNKQNPDSDWHSEKCACGSWHLRDRFYYLGQSELVQPTRRDRAPGFEP